MSQPVPIMVDGSLVGAAVIQENDVRFIATDMRTAEMDQTAWPSVAAVRRAVERIMCTGGIRNFNPPSIED